jgi:hypothetical protein
MTADMKTTADLLDQLARRFRKVTITVTSGKYYIVRVKNWATQSNESPREAIERLLKK